MEGTSLKVVRSEIAPGVVRLQEPDGPRFICQFVVAGDDAELIVDAGLPGSAGRTILPALRRRGRTLLLITHPDTDHCGGTADLVTAIPDVAVLVPEADRGALGDPERTVEIRYRRFAADGVQPDALELDRLRGRLGGPFRVDRSVRNGEELHLGARTCTLLHLPGHSPGHTGVWLERERLLIAADAVMGAGIPKTDGSLLYAPQFFSPDVYRATIERIARLVPEVMLCTHEPPLQGAAIARFLRESSEAVDALERLVAGVLRAGAGSLSEICAGVHEAHGRLPDGRADSLAMSVAGILDSMVAEGRARVERTGGGRAWRPTP